MKHHTKNKGDLGLMMVMADLAAHDIGVCVPLSEHMPFDLIAVSSDGKLSRIQAKYRKALNGAVVVPLRNSYADRNGSHVRLTDRSLFDAYAMYCPDTKTVYYIKNDEIPLNYTGDFTLRIIPTLNNQQKRTRMASDFEKPFRLFEMQSTMPKNSV